MNIEYPSEMQSYIKQQNIKINFNLCSSGLEPPTDHPGVSMFILYRCFMLLLCRKHIWIGCNDRTREGRFVWRFQNKTKLVTYSNWRPGQPDNYENEDCCMIGYYGTSGHYWNDCPCAGFVGLEHFICKR